MPTYTVFSPEGQLSAVQKADIAHNVARAHSEATGAQTFFVQVFFQEAKPGSWFMGGAPLEGRQVYICGHIRGGRPREMTDKLALDLKDVLCRCAALHNHEVWSYLVELPPSHMVEYGYALPMPGEEHSWLANMAPADRDRLEALGRAA